MLEGVVGVDRLELEEHRAEELGELVVLMYRKEVMLRRVVAVS